MKIAFLLLVLANLTLWLYERQHASNIQPSDAPAIAPGAYREPVVLARDLPNTPPIQTAVADPIAAQPTAQPAPTTPLACFEAGPFADNALFQRWSHALDDLQFDVQPDPRTRQQVFGYLVVFPTGSSQKALELAQQTLRDRDVNDFYPLNSGEYHGAISLGAFPKENQALVMQREMLGKGVQAVVKPRTRSSVQQYALIRFAESNDARWRALMQNYPQIPIKALSDADPFCAQSLTHKATETKSAASDETSSR